MLLSACSLSIEFIMRCVHDKRATRQVFGSVQRVADPDVALQPFCGDAYAKSHARCIHVELIALELLAYYAGPPVSSAHALAANIRRLEC